MDQSYSVKMDNDSMLVAPYKHKFALPFEQVGFEINLLHSIFC